MVMDSVAEPYLFQIVGQGLVIRAVLISIVGCVDGLYESAYRQIIFSVLIPKDVATP